MIDKVPLNILIKGKLPPPLPTRYDYFVKQLYFFENAAALPTMG